jgi:hypothetical protein
MLTEECRREAEKAISPLDKEAWLKLAADWLRHAQEDRRKTESEVAVKAAKIQTETLTPGFFGCSRCDNDGLPFP